MDDFAKTGVSARQVRRHACIAAVVWTLLAVGSVLWNALDRKHDAEESARIQARTAFDMDIAYRHWNAMHGGVYVPVTDKTQPNPDLGNGPERDITTPSGKRLTLLNPAYMTRQAHEFLQKVGGVQAHITSLKPIQAQNRPDAFEAKALESFEHGLDEFCAIEELAGQECMRLMRPLITEKSCLKCHASQGYREGDVRGGIGIAVPMASLRAIEKRALLTVLLAHLLIWGAGLGGLAFGGHRVLGAVGMQKRAEEMLRQNEQKYRALVEGTNDVVYSITAEGKVDFVGPQISRYGYSERDVLSHDLFEFIHPEDREAIAAVFKDRIQSGNTAPIEFRIVAKDGRAVWFLDNGKVRGDAAGRIIGLTGVLADITDLKRAEEALRESEERFRELVLNQGEGLGIVDPEERFTFVNPAGAEIFGVPHASLVGRTLKEYMTPEQYALVLQETEKRRAGEKSTYELEILRPDGKTRCLLLTAVPRTDKAGRFLGAFGLFRDITERKRAEDALRESTRFQQQLIDALPLPVFYKDADLRYIGCNRAFAELFHVSKEALMGKSVYDLAPKEIADIHSQEDQELLAYPGAKAYEATLKDWRGIHHAVFHKATFPAPGRKAGGLIGALMDITERKRIEDALRDSERGVSEALEFNKKILENPSIGILAYRESGQCILANEAAAKIVGTNVAGLLAQNFHQIQPWKKGGIYEAALQALRTDTAIQLETASTTTFGRNLWASLRFSTFQSRGEKHLLMFVSDVTEGKRAEEALKASEAELKEAQRLAQVGSWTLVPDSGEITWSEEMYRIYGSAPQQTVPSFEELPNRYTPESSLRLENATKQCVETGEPFHIELELVCPDGTRRWVIGRGEAIRDSNGRVVRFRGTAHDITERKRVETVLREREEQQQRILRTAMDGFWIADHTGRIRETNDACCRMLGYSREELCAKLISDLEVDEPTPVEVSQHMARIAQAGRERFETRQRTKDGRIIEVEVAVANLDLERGLVFAFLRDITQRKRAEEALKASEAELKEAQRLAQVGNWTHVVGTGEITWSEELYRIFGRDPKQPAPTFEELPGNFTPESRLRLEKAVQQSVETGEPHQVELELVRPDGTHRWVIGRGEAIRDSNGRVIRLRGTAQDITERKRAETALREREEQQQTILRTAMDGFWIADHNGRIRETNDACCRMLGYSREELCAKRISDFEANEPSPVEVSQHTARIVQAGQERFESRHRTKDGRIIDVEVAVANLDLEHGLVFAFLHDITQRKRAEEALKASEAELKEAQRLAQVGNWTLVPETGEVTWSEELYRIFGRDPKQPVPSFKEPPNRYTPESCLRIEKAVKQCVETGEPYLLELELVRPDGTHGWTVTRGEAIRDSNGRVVRLRGYAQDITERKRADEALRDSERKISEALEFNKKILSTSSIGILTYRASGQCVSANEAAAKIAGTTVAGLLAQNFHQLQSWKEKGLYETALKALETDAEQEIEAHVSTTFGRAAWLHLRFSSFLSGGEKHLLVFSQDITARKRAEEALRQSDERYRLLADNAGDFVSLTHADGRRLYVSPSYFRVTGWTPEEIHATDWRTRVHPEDLSATVRAREANLRGQTTILEHRTLLKDGSWLWLESRCSPVVGPDGKVLEMVVCGRDITARKRAEEALRESEQRERTRANDLQALLEAVPAAVLIAQDPDCRRVVGNRAADAMLRLPGSSEVSLNAPAGGRPAHFRIFKDGRQLSVEDLPVRQAARGVAVRDFEYSIAFADGTVRHLLGNAAPLLDEQGRPRGSVAAYVDITESKLAEEETQALREELYHVRRMMTMGQLTAAIAHELNQPLAAIVSNAQAAQRFLGAGKLGEQGFREILDDIAADAQRAGAVILRIRDVLRKGKLDLKFLDLNSLVREVAELLSRGALQKDVAVTFDLAPRLPLVRADWVQLQQVVLNLLSNAFESMETVPLPSHGEAGARGGHRLTIRTSQPDANTAQVAVEDTGAGIPESKLAHVFEPFFTTKSAGMGMGLAISRSIIFAHGGRIWAGNNPGGGATVQFAIPISEGAKPRGGAATGQGNGTGPEGRAK